MNDIQQAAVHLKAALSSLETAKTTQPRFIVDLINVICVQMQGYLNYVELIASVFERPKKATKPRGSSKSRKQRRQ